MEDVKRGPGRPPNVSREAQKSVPPSVSREEQKSIPPSVSREDREPAVKPEVKEESPKDRLIEVELLRKYAPAGQDTEILKTVPAGTVMKVPQHEASRLLKAGYARGTDKTFD